MGSVVLLRPDDTRETLRERLSQSFDNDSLDLQLFNAYIPAERRHQLKRTELSNGARYEIFTGRDERHDIGTIAPNPTPLNLRDVYQGIEDFLNEQGTSPQALIGTRQLPVPDGKPFPDPLYVTNKQWMDRQQFKKYYGQ